ncbi:MAG: PAS domain S-box protein [Pseudomonadota bacterium]
MSTDDKTRAWSRFQTAAWSFALLVVLIVVWGVSRITVYNTLKNNVQAETIAATKAQVEMGTQFIAEHQSNILGRLSTLASRNFFIEAFLSPDPDTVVSALGEITREKDLDAAFITDPEGILLLHVPAAGRPGALDLVPGTPVLTEQTPRQPLAVTFCGPDDKIKGPAVTMTVPIFDHQKKLSGFLGVRQNISVWEEFFSRLTARPGRGFFILDSRDCVIAGAPSANLDSDIIEKVHQMIDPALEPESPIGELVSGHLGFHPTFLAVAKVPRVGWYFVVAHDFKPVMAPLGVMFRNITIFLALLFFCLFFLGSLLTARYQAQKQTLAKAGNEARRLEAEVQARTVDLYYSTERYRSLVEGQPDIIYEMDRSGRLAFVSHAVESILGYTPEELIGLDWRGLVFPEDRPKFDRESRDAENGGDLTLPRIRHQGKTGRIRWLTIHSRGLFDDRGELVGRLGAARDVTYEIITEGRVGELSRLLIRAQEEERRNLALDLHDELGQVLGALKIGLQSLIERGPLENGFMVSEVSRLIRLSQKIMDKIRNLAYTLRPAILDNFGLVAAIEDLCESLTETGETEIIRRLAEFDETRAGQEIKTTLFRFVQEGLTNAIKHSGSRKMEVELKMNGSRLVVSVADHGRGFQVDQALNKALTEKKLGLWGMRERIGLVGGALAIKSGPRGTILTTEIDLEERKHDRRA